MEHKRILFALGMLALGRVQAQPSSPDYATLQRSQERAEQNARGDGERDGNEFGREYFYQLAYEEYYRGELERCLFRLAQEARDRGNRVGARTGEAEGRARGQQDGERAGREEGYTQGLMDGQHAADAQARQEAYLPAWQEGQSRARNSDAQIVGAQLGKEIGDQLALKAACEQEYPRGQQAYVQERFARSPLSRVKLHFRSAGHRAVSWGGSSSPGGSVLAIEQRKMGSHYQPEARPPMPTAAANQAYRRCYEEAYRKAYDRAYQGQEFDFCNKGRRDGEAQARRDAQQRNMEPCYQEAKDRAHRRSYDSSYLAARQSAYLLAYQIAQKEAHQQSYRQHYELLRQRYFTQFREEAYRDAYRHLLQQAREQASKASRAARYPVHAKSQLNLGRSAAHRDFQNRPLRWLSVTPCKQGKPLVFEDNHYTAEAGQEICLNFQARNFGPELTPKIRIVLEEDQGLVYLPENIFHSLTTCPANTVFSEDGDSVFLKLRPEASGHTVRVSLEIRNSVGVCDSKTLTFEVPAFKD